MRVLLTGGYGCIGSWILRNLLERSDQVWVYDLKEDTRRLRLLVTAEQLRQIPFVQGDVTDLPRLRDVFLTHQITHVVHLAGLQVPVCRADPLLGARVNVLGTLAVFGPPDKYRNGPLPDDVPLYPLTHYGVFKCCNEGNAQV